MSEETRAGSHRSVRGGKVGEVEDVGRLAADLEPRPLPDREVAEDRRVDVTPARSIQRILTNGAVGAGGTGALLRAGGVTPVAVVTVAL